MKEQSTGRAVVSGLFGGGGVCEAFQERLPEQRRDAGDETGEEVDIAGRATCGPYQSPSFLPRASSVRNRSRFRCARARNCR
jgi:hypothetical protein